MNRRDRYRIQASIKDVIDRLDSVPMRRYLKQTDNLVQLTNHAHDAHLGIERGLKALIVDAKASYKHIHDLGRLFETLSANDKASADFLALAFDDAVRFFGLDLNFKGSDFDHFRSVQDYIAEVGTEKVFKELRYWTIENPSPDQSDIPIILPEIHRELLYAVWCLVKGRRATVSDRVERDVMHAMTNGRGIVHLDGETSTEQAVGWYGNWLFETHPTCCSALEEAVHCNFAVNGDEFVTQTLRDAYNDLRQSKDPAVRYYVSTLTDLPKGSQQRIPDAVPEMKWLNNDQTSGMVETPAGTPLGFIEKYADGRWLIKPLADDLDVEPATAKTDVVASRYLVNRLTSQINVTVNGETRLLRMVGKRFFLPDAGWSSGDVDPGAMGIPATTCPLEFWDAGHGLCLDEQVRVVLQSDTSNQFVSVLNGTVTSVEGQKVSIAGVIVGMSAESVGYDSVSD